MQTRMRHHTGQLAVVMSLLAGLTACGGGNSPVEQQGETPGVTISDDFVDLRPQNTRLKNQGNRNTCITFASTAALEAAYKEAGYGDLDLSEEFASHMQKMNWLHPNWGGGGPAPQLSDVSADYVENQVAAFGGGNGYGYVRHMANGLAIPVETVMPYQASIDLTTYCSTCSDWTDSYWNVQRNVDGYNLNPAVLKQEALVQQNYYSVFSHQSISATDTDAIEEALRNRNEVVWDFTISGNRSNGVWMPDGSDPVGPHAMLIVGYDRRDSANPFFIVKNSWGTTHRTAGADGWTRISYNYVRAYGLTAGYILEAAQPAPKSEYAFLGKWDLSYDGWKGELHIYHIPGMAQMFLDDAGVAVEDKRLGVFYATQSDGSSKPYRVNGSIVGNHLTFYFDTADDTNTRWDILKGRRFDYRLFKGDSATAGDAPGAQAEVNLTMAGMHQDPGGTLFYGGYARKQGGFITTPAAMSTPIEARSYLGEWRANINGVLGTFNFNTLDDSVEGAEAGVWNGLRGTFNTINGSPMEITGLVSEVNPMQVILRTGIVKYFELNGRNLSRNPGVMAGVAGLANGFYAKKISNPRLQITSPTPPVFITADKIDSVNPKLYYAEVSFTGIGYDSDSSETSPANLIWYVGVNGGALTQIGIGNTLSNVRLDLVEDTTTTYRIVLDSIADGSVAPEEIVVTIEPFI